MFPILQFRANLNLIRTILLLGIFILSKQADKSPGAFAQTIGFQPQFNFGFNPYLSPVYGYGLGLPYGAGNFSPSRYPWLLNSLTGGSPFTDVHGFMSKIHAKAFLKKLALGQYGLQYPHGSIKDKINLIKHPEYAFTPYSAGYGFGKHYGSAVVPNDPYKSVYGNYYDSPTLTQTKSPSDYDHQQLASQPYSYSAPPLEGSFAAKPYSYLKPIAKVGAILTTAAILGKKALESPVRLNPAGMILHQPLV